MYILFLFLFPQAPKYQNTYRLNAYNPFKVDPVDKIVKMIMINKLEDISYDGTECSKICESVATDIREKIKNLNFDRYNYILNLNIMIFCMIKKLNN